MMSYLRTITYRTYYDTKKVKITQSYAYDTVVGKITKYIRTAHYSLVINLLPSVVIGMKTRENRIAFCLTVVRTRTQHLRPSTSRCVGISYVVKIFLTCPHTNDLIKSKSTIDHRPSNDRIGSVNITIVDRHAKRLRIVHTRNIH